MSDATFEFDWTPEPGWMQALGIHVDVPTVVTLSNTIDPTWDGEYVITGNDDGSYTLTPRSTAGTS